MPIPAGGAVKVLTGQVTMDGDALANAAGQESDVLVVIGQLLVTGPVSRVGYRRLMVVGEIVAPIGSEGAIGAAIGQLVGATIYYPWAEGAAVQVLAGDVRLAPEALANADGGENDILVVAGTVLVTGPVTRVGFRRVIVAGELLAPQESETVLGPRAHVAGQVIYYTGTPRRFTGSDRFSRTFFELLEAPVSLILQGSFVIEADVPFDLVRAKLSGLCVQGELRAPREVVPLLQVLATVKHGTIAPLDASTNEAEPAGDRS